MEDTTFALRRAQRRWLGALPTAAVGLAGMISVLVSALRSWDRPEVGSLVFAIGFLGVFTALPAWLAWRGFQMRVVLASSEVVVYNLLTARHVSFAEIAGFEVDRRGGSGYPRTLLRLTAGPHGIPRSVIASGLSPGVGSSNSNYARNCARGIAQIEPVIDAMNAELDLRRGTPPSTAERLAAAHPAFRAIPHDD